MIYFLSSYIYLLVIFLFKVKFNFKVNKKIKINKLFY